MSSTDIELEVGDTVRLTSPFTETIAGTAIAFGVTIETGELFSVSGFDGDGVLLQRIFRFDKTWVDFVLRVSSENLQIFIPVQNDEGGGEARFHWTLRRGEEKEEENLIL